MKCPPGAEVLRWLDSAATLPGRRRTALRRHVETCSRCRSRADSLAALLATVQSLSCPSTAHLSALAAGEEMPAEHRRVLNAHLRACLHCRTLFGRAEEFLLAEAAVEYEAQRPLPRRLARLFAAGARPTERSADRKSRGKKRG